jgi:hypothetical protein
MPHHSTSGSVSSSVSHHFHYVWIRIYSFLWLRAISG